MRKNWRRYSDAVQSCCWVSNHFVYGVIKCTVIHDNSDLGLQRDSFGFYWTTRWIAMADFVRQLWQTLLPFISLDPAIVWPKCTAYKNLDDAPWLRFRVVCWVTVMSVKVITSKWCIASCNSISALPELYAPDKNCS